MEFTPILSAFPKQLDSLRAHHKALGVRAKDGISPLSEDISRMFDLNQVDTAET